MTETDLAQAASALLTEHLQYTPLSLIDDIINSVNNFVYQGVGSLETGLLTTPAERLGFKAVEQNADDAGLENELPEAKQEIEEGLHKLETLLNSTVDKNFDKFEIYVLRNILSVPADLVNWVRLSHYEHITYPTLDNAPTAEGIQLLRRKLAASRTVSRALLEEQTRNEALLRQLRGLVSSSQPGVNNLSFLATQTSTTQQTLTTNMTFALSQLPALRALLAELRPKLAALKATKAGLHMNTAKDEVREERRGYIEQRIQSHLQRNGEDTHGDSSMVPGVRVDPEEVSALERVAATFEPA